jgi:spermidine synthase
MSSVKSESKSVRSVESHRQTTIIAAVVVAGIDSIVTQIAFLREFLTVFCGNELIIGVVMANWMVLTAAGAFLGKYSERIRDRFNLLGLLILLMGLAPVVTVFFMRLLRNILFAAGSTPDLVQIIITSFLFIAPFCLISGFTFTVAAVLLSEQRRGNRVSQAYSWEALGSVAGGFAFTVSYLFSVQTFERLFFVLLVSLVASYLISISNRNNSIKIITISTALAILLFGRTLNLEHLTIGYMMKGQEVLLTKDTPHGTVTVTEQGNQYNFYENNILLFSTDDPTSNEESVHYAMLQHPCPEEVLLIAGGISGTTTEILKYNVKRIDYVELNPVLLQIGGKFTQNLQDTRIYPVTMDGRLFIRTTNSKYDVILINLPDPVTAQINRYYTTEFFADVKKILKHDGVVGLSLTSSADYMNEEARKLRSVLYSTLNAHFLNILVVPGWRDYFIAADTPLNINIAHIVISRGINNLYVNQYYIDDDLLMQRSNRIKESLYSDVPVNKDFRPVSYYYQLLLWLRSFDISYWILVIVFVGFVIYTLARTNVITYGMYTAGFAGSAIEIILLLAFQVLYGYVYQMIGFLIAIFMGGLGVGAVIRGRIVRIVTMKVYMFLQTLLAILIIFVPPFLFFLQKSDLNAWTLYAAFAFPTFVIACFVGLIFSASSELHNGSYSRVASHLYGFDLIGSAVGALIVSAFLIPLLGIIVVCFIVGIVVFSGAVLSFIVRNKFVIKMVQ